MEQKQKAIVVGVNLHHQEDFAYQMEELCHLASACDVEVVGELTQHLNRIHSSHYIGKGKVQELLAFILETGANMVIFNDELSPSQIRNLEADLSCKIVDRTLLILDIFAERAKTREAKLQIETAYLQYMLPRLVGMRKSLGRQSGGVGTKNKGVGEKKLELDRRKIEERITALNKELKALAAQRETQRKQRKKKGLPVVSLVGYTNAGKSTIMNTLIETFHHDTNKQVFEKDMLFATLETSVRNITLPDNKSFLLTDTVGFVNKLPHHLVKAFRSTLEEAINADLLIHVVDFSNPQYKQLMEITIETLQSIGITDMPVIYVFNKADLTDKQIPYVENNGVYLSAKQKIGIDELIQMIRKHIFTDYKYCQMLIPYDQGNVVSYFNENAHVLSTSYEHNGTILALECKAIDAEKYKHFILHEQ